MRFAAVLAAVLSFGLAAVAAPTASVQSLDVAYVAPVDVVLRDAVPAPLVAHRVDVEAAPVAIVLSSRDEDFITFLKDKQVKIKAVTDAILAKTSAKETNLDAYKPHIDALNSHIDDISVAAKATNVVVDVLIVVQVLTAILSDILKAVQSLVQLVQAGIMILKSMAPHLLQMILSFNLNNAFLGFQLAVTSLSGILTTLFKAIGADLAGLAGIKL
ncbi:hypothetical protein BOTBODRAFT_46333 [Botryobasidium botryosum FD-172 SS1]|uniref:Uncharacterized protein n=1 Tax=Botryobasidium botryosum (strain FD-172 SS1) TaxID=930990 RepID=A0A067MA30_BOTB1|nr:hypothetical protein BOTBODRAFT_46333 [Botryobasidium botryosum FD-172 SS1]